MSGFLHAHCVVCLVRHLSGHGCGCGFSQHIFKGLQDTASAVAASSYIPDKLLSGACKGQVAAAVESCSCNIVS